ncbi:MAG: leucine-rich repeat domain-containing protein [Patescibacteria group bacterium]
MKIAYLSVIIALGLLAAGCNTNYTNPTNQTDVPSVPATVSKSKILDLSNQGLENIPASTFDQQNLEELNVSNNRLTSAIQAEIRKLKNLRVLKASNNQMTGVPAEIGQLQNLEVLDLSNNQLTGLPNELANLKKLKTLNLSGNQYSKQDLDIIRQALPNVNYIL